MSARVYIVDDDAAVRSALGLLARSCGWTPCPFDSAQAFLDQYQPDNESCLLLDLNMPGMNGAELCEALRTRESQLPVFIVTAHQDTPLANRALKAGARAVLAKPVDSDELLALLTPLLMENH